MDYDIICILATLVILGSSIESFLYHKEPSSYSFTYRFCCHIMEVLSYTLILALQLLLLLYDIAINSLIDLVNPINVVQLVLFIGQDICLVFQLIVLSLELFNTSSFQAGFTGRMLRKFRASILITIVYFGLCVGLHVWTLTLRWNDVNVFVWNNGGYYTLYIIQRGWSPIYYYYYKRTALRLGDSRFYGNPDIFKNQLPPT